jgi:hypothetical protein
VSYLQGHEISTVEDLIIDAALRKICGLPTGEYNQTPLEIDEATCDHAFHEGAAYWMQWACGICLSFDGTAHVSHRSELNRMAVSQWLQAIAHLQAGNPVEGRRFFRRAVTLGGLYGTVSNPTIQWTYAASFFPDVE